MNCRNSLSAKNLFNIAFGVIALLILNGCSSLKSDYSFFNQKKPVRKIKYVSACEDKKIYTLAQVVEKTSMAEEDLKKVKKYWHLTNDDLYCMKPKILKKSLRKINNPKPSHPKEAALFRRESLINENGVIPEKAYQKAFAQLEKMPGRSGKAVWGKVRKVPMKNGKALEGATAGIDSASWTWLGPGNIGGRLRSCVIHPVNKDTMWVGSIAGGIWKTTDGGTSWAAEDDFMTNLAVSCMVMDPTDSNTIYAGTGEGFGNADALRGAGVFKTTDGGTNWTQLGSTTSSNWYYVNRLAINGDASVLLAATNTNLYRSTDDGATWTPVLVGRIQDVKFDPNDNSKAVAGNKSNNAYYSTDGGATWTAAAWDFAPSQSPRLEFAYSAGAANVVWCAMDENSGDLYKSTNGGANWVYKGTSAHLGTQGWYDNVIWVDPTTPNDVYIGGIDLYRYSESGNSKTAISRWQSSPTSAHADHHFIFPHPDFGGGGGDDNTVFFCNDGGIYKGDISQVDGGAGGNGWTELNNNLGTTQLYSAAGNSTSGVIIGGCQDNGTLGYSGGTETWVEVFGGDGGYCAFDQNNQNYCYGEYVYLAIFRNTNGGGVSADWSKDYINGEYYNSGWQWKSAPYTITDSQNSTAEFIAPFILDPNVVAQTRILAGGRQLWRTNDAKTANTNSVGPSWASIKAAAGGSYLYNITAIAVAPGNSDVIWVGHRNGEVYKTVNGTNVSPTWTQVDTNGIGLPNRRIQRITVDANDNDLVYVCLGGFSADNVYKTTDGGTTWADTTSNLPAAPMRSLVIHPDESNWLYVGSEVGIFASDDGGANWSASNDGPTNCSVDELFWMDDSGDPVLVAATHGRGVFKITIPAASAGLDIDDVTVTEGDAPGTVNADFTVTLTGAVAFPVTVDYATADNTATVADGDYVTVGATTLTFNANGTKTATITVNGDDKDEDDETFYVNLSNAVGATINDAQGVGTITDDDPAPNVTLTLDNANIAEGGGVATFTATLDAISGRDVTVDLAFTGTASGSGTDYTASGSQIVIAAGDLTGTITVTADDDTLDEDNETVIVDIDYITNGTEAVAQQQTTTITDDDLPPTMGIDDVTVTEGDTGTTAASFTVSLSTPSGRDITVDYASADGTATIADSDYTAAAGTLTISAGDASGTVTVNVNGDQIDEDDETFVVNLSGETNVTLADAQGAGTITDDDTATISVSDATATEVDTGGTSTATFTLSLACASSKIVTVDYTTADGTATAGVDYTAKAGTLTFNIGDTSATVDVTITGDFTNENDETFTFDLSNPVNAPLGTADQGTGTITDDDTTYTLTVNNGTGGGSVVNGVTVTITANAPNTGLKFKEWTGDTANVASTTTSPTTLVMPEGDVTVSASYEVDPVTAEKVSYGYNIETDAAEVSGMDAEFTKRPKIYGKYTDPIKNKAMTGTTKVVTKISKTAPANIVDTLWVRNIYLYSKTAWKNANKAPTTTRLWLAGDATQNAEVTSELWISYTKADKTKGDELFRGTKVVPPTITSIERWDGGSPAAGVHTNSKLVIKGTYFGVKAPFVSLEYNSNGVLKQKKLKVLKPLRYADYKGSAGKSCMDLTVTTGVSEVTVLMPPSGWPAGTYALILDNKIGLDAANDVVILADGGGTAPVANDDTATLYVGASNYEIDVLANDQDADSDSVSIIVGNAGVTTQLGKVSASKGKIKYTPPSGIDLSGAAFTDTFTYSLDDGHGSTSGNATVTVTINQLTVTSVTRWDGNAIDAGGVNPGALIIINGNDFGVKAPVILLADGTGQHLKLKPFGPESADYKGKAKKSYTNLTTGVSKVYVQMPTSWAWPTGTYTLKVSNKLNGVDSAQTLTLSAAASNTAPTANNDTANIESGSANYLIDVLANDTDTESEKVTIVLTSKTSTQRAKLSVDKKTNKVKYVRATGVACPFTDSFTYSLIDANGQQSGTGTVTVNAALK